jgi:hypothetical protein
LIKGSREQSPRRIVSTDSEPGKEFIRRVLFQACFGSEVLAALYPQRERSSQIGVQVPPKRLAAPAGQAYKAPLGQFPSKDQSRLCAIGSDEEQMVSPLRTVNVSCLIAACAVGCGSDELKSPAAAQLKGIGILYLDYAVSRNGKGPATEQDFKKHLRGLPDHVVNSHGINPKAMDAAFVAHEKTGKNGTRLIAFANGKVELADEVRLQELLSPKE